MSGGGRAPPAAACAMPAPAWRRIAAEVAARHGMTVRSMMERARFRHLVLARQEAMYRVAAETRLTLPQIGRRLGRHHTTILHGIRAHAARSGLPMPRRRW
jgi:chromosomal replication initiation ATPase DnaA